MYAECLSLSFKFALVLSASQDKGAKGPQPGNGINVKWKVTARRDFDPSLFGWSRESSYLWSSKRTVSATQVLDDAEVTANL